MQKVAIMVAVATIAIAAPAEARPTSSTYVAPYGSHTWEECNVPANVACTTAASVDARTGAVAGRVSLVADAPAIGVGRAVALAEQSHNLVHAAAALRVTFTVQVDRASHFVVGPGFGRAFAFGSVKHQRCAECGNHRHVEISEIPASTEPVLSPQTMTVVVEVRNPAGAVPKGTLVLRGGLDVDAHLRQGLRAEAAASGSVTKIFVERLAA